jgi:hypothetical protein
VILLLISYIFAVLYPCGYRDQRDYLPFQLISGKLGVKTIVLRYNMLYMRLIGNYYDLE